MWAGQYLHQVAHGVPDLHHGWPLARFFVPAAGHQSLNGFWKVLDQRRTSTCETVRPCEDEAAGQTLRHDFDPRTKGGSESRSRLTSVHGPHDAESRSADLLEGLPASDDLPQDDAPAENVTLLTVVTA